MKHAQKKKLSLGTIISFLITIICIGGIIYSGINIYLWKQSIDKNANIQDSINERVKTENDKIQVDFNKLKKNNPDTVGYLKVNNTNIEYVVVKTTNNDYYLTHNFNKEQNVAGWVFMDYKNTNSSNDKNTVIYGHNMKDGSMFGSLKNTLKTEWQNNKKNRTIQYITEKETLKYEVFSTYVVNEEEYYIQTDFNDEEDYSNFLNKVKSRSNYDYQVNIKTTDKVLTLSSCAGYGNKRVVLHAKLI